MIISVLTLGCKQNKYESDCMVKILKQNSYNVITSLEYADIYIINTCAVTNEGEKKSRQYISKCVKLNKKCKIIVCGCASQNNVNQFKNKANVYSIFGTENKQNILRYIQNSCVQVDDIPTKYNSIESPLVSTTRGYLKIQDGCNNFCSYCLIPYLRGRSRSRELNDCIEEAHKLAKDCKEIVLTGIDISDYKPSLATLMSKLSSVKSRIRIGSLEVCVIDDNLLKVLSNMPNFCPQFHLSLQSGCAQTLKKMNRHYTPDEYLDKVKLIRTYFPTASITTDVIVGFGEESESQFMECVEFVKKVGFAGIHIFPYSVRNGTVASKLYADLPSEIKKQRVDFMENIAKDCFIKYVTPLLNKNFTVLTEDEENGFVVGYTENYIKCYLEKNTPKNQLVEVKLKNIFKDGVIAEVEK